MKEGGILREKKELKSQNQFFLNATEERNSFSFIMVSVCLHLEGLTLVIGPLSLLSNKDLQKRYVKPKLH